MKKLFLLLIIVAIVGEVNAQDRVSINQVTGNQAALRQDIRDNIYVFGLSSVIDRYIYENKHNPGQEGHRVQLFFGSREEANKVKTNFLKKYPESKAYMEYQAPNFKVRVGNFRNQLKAEKFLYDIKADFPSAYVVNERIEMPEL